MNEPTNAIRARWAELVLEFHRNIVDAGDCGVDEEDALCDLLVNLMHCCNQGNIPESFDEELERARKHFDEERNVAT